MADLQLLKHSTASYWKHGGQSMHRLTSSVMPSYQFPRRQALMTAKNTGRWHFNLLQLMCMPWCCRKGYPKWLDQQLLKPQYGFRPGRERADALFSLRSLCSLVWNNNKTSYICMLDLAKAFASADRAFHDASCLPGAHLPSLYHF